MATTPRQDVLSVKSSLNQRLSLKCVIWYFRMCGMWRWPPGTRTPVHLGQPPSKCAKRCVTTHIHKEIRRTKLGRNCWKGFREGWKYSFRVPPLNSGTITVCHWKVSWRRAKIKTAHITCVGLIQFWGLSCLLNVIRFTLSTSTQGTFINNAIRKVFILVPPSSSIGLDGFFDKKIKIIRSTTSFWSCSNKKL